MSTTAGTDFVIEDLGLWLEWLRADRSKKTFQTAAYRGINDALDILYRKQLTLAAQHSWSGDFERSIKVRPAHEVAQTLLSGVVEGEVGPGVSMGYPDHVLTVEAGRRAGSRVGPYGPGSRLFRWASEKGFNAAETKAVAVSIARRGLPQRSGRWPYQPPTVVARSYTMMRPSVERHMNSIGNYWTAEFLKGVPHA